MLIAASDCFCKWKVPDEDECGPCSVFVSGGGWWGGTFYPKVCFCALRRKERGVGVCVCVWGGWCYFNWAQRGAGRLWTVTHVRDGCHYLTQIACARKRMLACVWKGNSDGFQRGWSHCSLVTMVTRLSGPQGGKSEEVGVWGEARRGV